MTAHQHWIDTAKGAVIILVVLGHVVTNLESEGLLHGTWALVGQALVTVRMPAFFLRSGLFAARAIRKPLSALWSTKIYRFAYLFVLWSLLYIPIQMLYTSLSGLTVGQAALSWVATSLRVDGFLWYFAALAAFFLAAWALRPLSPLVQLGLSFALSAVAGVGWLDTGSFGVDHMAQYLFYFLAGCHLSAMLRAHAERATAWRLLGYIAAWATLGLGLFAVGGRGLLAANVLLPLLAVPAALMAAVLLDRRLVARPLRMLGGLTLPIFVLHPAFVIFACGIVAKLAPSGGGTLTDALLPVMLTAIILGASLVTYWALRRVPFIFEPHRHARVLRG